MLDYLTAATLSRGLRGDLASSALPGARCGPLASAAGSAAAVAGVLDRRPRPPVRRPRL